ncbi:MAG TPA: HAMP domain-containing protein, partial [Pseudonocardia sp.]|nr:HAMP domain-containing protein [Pseudonocardia sp.]
MLRLSLRWRVAVAFGLGSLVLAGAIAFVTWSLASGYMLRQREQSAIRQAEVSVRLVESNLRTAEQGLEDLLTGLTSDSESSVLLARPDGWLTSGRQIDPATLPEPLLVLAGEGVPARQRLVLEGVPVLAVALPVASPGSFYVQLFSLSQLDRVFRFLSGVLLAGTAASAVLGVALGSWASSRALRPLTELTEAASRVARGDLRARLPEQDDPDL